MLCGGGKSEEKLPAVEEEGKYVPAVKKRRLTFALDRALIKLSRRNILIE